MAEKTIHLVAQDGTKIAGSVWEAPGSDAILLWIHGFAEHRRRYAHFASFMIENGITVAAIDVRGHGESDGRRGYVKNFSDYFKDVSILMHWSREQFGKIPCILGCHSHGGLIVSRYLQEAAFPRPIQASVFSAPFLGLGLPTPAWKTTMANVVAKIIPTLAIPTGLPADYVSRDPKIVSAYATDPLVFTTATARWVVEMTRNQKIALSRAPEIKLPALVMQGLGDKIVSIEAVKSFFADLGSSDKKWIEYEGFYHEILNEIDRERVYRDMLSWIKQHI